MRFMWLFLLVTASVPAAVDGPKTRKIKLEAITKNVVHIAVGRSTKLIFPWILDKDSDYLPFDALISNNAVWSLRQRPGQNYIDIFYHNINRDWDGFTADLTISTNGYHIALVLVQDSSTKQHFQTIQFEVSEADRLKLLDDHLQALRKQLEAERKNMMAEIDTLAEKKAIAIASGMILSNKEVDSVNEYNDLEVNGGRAVRFYVNDLHQFSDVSIFDIEITNYTNKPINIHSIDIDSLSKKNKSDIIVVSSAADVVEPGQSIRGTLSTDFIFKGRSDRVLFSLETSIGQVKVKW